ncbi:MAG: hypothetical protein P8Y70_10920 [Candidatus Lokiarchaeota archaeon]
MPRRRKARKAPDMPEDPLDEYSAWDKRIAKTFYFAIIVSSVIVFLGVWGWIISLIITSKLWPAFLSIGLGFQIAIIAAVATGHFLLLVLFYTLFRGGIFKLCRVLFKDRLVAKKYEDYSTLRFLIAITLTGGYITITGILIGVLPYTFVEGLIGLFNWMLANLNVWQWVIAIGCIFFVVITFFFIGFVLWNHGVYAVLKRVKRIDEEIEIDEELKIEALKDADEQALRKAYKKYTGNKPLYRGKETEGYIEWKNKLK